MTLKDLIGKTIKSIEVNNRSEMDITFTDGTVLELAAWQDHGMGDLEHHILSYGVQDNG